MISLEERDKILEVFRESKQYFEEVIVNLPKDIHQAINRIMKYYSKQLDESPKQISKSMNWQKRIGLEGWEVFFCPETDNYRFVIENIEPQEVIYDVGAGDLRLDLVLSQRCKKVYAVEINPMIIGKSIELIGYDMPKNLISICADALKFPLPKDVTTIVVLVRHLIHPLPEEWYEKRIISNDNYQPLYILEDKVKGS